MKKITEKWKAFNNYWLHDFPGQLLVVKYEDVKKDIASEVKRMTAFLNISVTDEALECTAKNSGGSHHRIHKQGNMNQDPFTKEMIQDIDSTVCSVEKYMP